MQGTHPSRQALQTTVWLITALLAVAIEPAWALRCKGKIIDTQDRASEIRRLCGEPDLRDEWTNAYGTVVQEQWYYNFGPRRLLHILTLRAGRLAHMDTDGYGFIPDSGHQTCRPHQIQPGMNKLSLRHLCGEPDEVSVYSGYGSPDGYSHAPRQATQHLKREEWHYNFGPRHFRRTVILENGRVRYIQSEGYGD